MRYDAWGMLESVGLSLDIIGVLLVWQCGLPPDFNPKGESALLLEGTDQKAVVKGKRYGRLSHLGIGLVVVGFALQLLGNLVD